MEVRSTQTVTGDLDPFLWGKITRQGDPIPRFEAFSLAECCQITLRGGDELDIGIRLEHAWLRRYHPLLLFASIFLHWPRKDKAIIKPASLLFQD